MVLENAPGENITASVSAPEFNAAALTRTGWETMTPLESDPVHASAANSTLSRNASSFLSVDGPGVVLTAWKLAENGDGSILRLEDVSGHAGSVRITSRYLRITGAWLTNVLEDNETRLAAGPDGITVSVLAFGIVTVRIQTQPAGGQR